MFAVKICSHSLFFPFFRLNVLNNWNVIVHNKMMKTEKLLWKWWKVNHVNSKSNYLESKSAWDNSKSDCNRLYKYAKYFKILWYHIYSLLFSWNHINSLKIMIIDEWWFIPSKLWLWCSNSKYQNLELSTSLQHCVYSILKYCLL
jgi:hypothetical protein